MVLALGLTTHVNAKIDSILTSIAVVIVGILATPIMLLFVLLLLTVGLAAVIEEGIVRLVKVMNIAPTYKGSRRMTFSRHAPFPACAAKESLQNKYSLRRRFPDGAKRNAVSESNEPPFVVNRERK